MSLIFTLVNRVQALGLRALILRLSMVFAFFLLASSILIPTGFAFAKQSLKWVHVIPVDGDFETITSFLKSSIEEEGLVISDVGDVADMLSRTKDAVVGAVLVYKSAKIYQFCSVEMGLKLFAIAPENIGGCPLNIFAYELKTEPDVVYIGYRVPPFSQAGASGPAFREVDEMLSRILKRAAE